MELSYWVVGLICDGIHSSYSDSTLFVGNLSFNIGEDDLEEFFSSNGHPVESVRIITAQGKPKGSVRSFICIVSEVGHLCCFMLGRILHTIFYIVAALAGLPTYLYYCSYLSYV